ncbi:MAG: hypothetical protein IKS31_09120 [Clostridia bacterium]|nr:hypothetical protein [Clostridia bacterium]MBR4459105.1 hypothetical protein [Clostridia bacterium]
MIHLLRYEVRRTRTVKLALLGVSVVLEAIFLLAVMRRSRPGTVLSGILLFVLAMAGTLASGLSSVILLHRDLTTEEGYMLFLTPHRCWSILGAKMLECVISLTVCVAFFAGLIYFDVRYLFSHQGQLHSYWKIGTEFLSNPTFYLQDVFRVNADFPIQVDLRDGTLILCGFISYVATWESYMAAATLAIVLAQTVLPGRRRSVIGAFLIFAAIGFLINWSQTALPALAYYQTSLLMASGLALAESLAMYFIAAPIMQSRLSV